MLANTAAGAERRVDRGFAIVDPDGAWNGAPLGAGGTRSALVRQAIECLDAGVSHDWKAGAGSAKQRPGTAGGDAGGVGTHPAGGVERQHGRRAGGFAKSRASRADGSMRAGLYAFAATGAGGHELRLGKGAGRAQDRKKPAGARRRGGNAGGWGFDG